MLPRQSRCARTATSSGAVEFPSLSRVDVVAAAYFYLARPTARFTIALHFEGSEGPASHYATPEAAAMSRRRPEPPVNMSRVYGANLRLAEVCSGLSQVSAAFLEVGGRTTANVESDPTCRWLSEARLPNTTHYFDNALDEWWNEQPTEELSTITHLFGGFPCQGYSRANRDRRGADDPRSLIARFVLGILHHRSVNFYFEGSLLGFWMENVLAKVEDFRDSAVEPEIAAVKGTQYGRTELHFRPATLGLETQERPRLLEGHEPNIVLGAIGAAEPPTGNGGQPVPPMIDLIVPPDERPKKLFALNFLYSSTSSK